MCHLIDSIIAVHLAVLHYSCIVLLSSAIPRYCDSPFCQARCDESWNECTFDGFVGLFQTSGQRFPYTPMPFYFSDIFVTLMLKRRNFWWSDGRCCRRCRRIRPATNLGTDLRPIVHNRGPNSIKGCPTRGSYIPHQYQYRKKQWPHHRRTECRPTPQRPDWRHPRTFL